MKKRKKRKKLTNGPHLLLSDPSFDVPRPNKKWVGLRKLCGGARAEQLGPKFRSRDSGENFDRDVSHPILRIKLNALNSCVPRDQSHT